MEPYPLEPFRIKMTEPVRPTTREERERLLQKAGYNVFRLPSWSILVDLLTDSGTGAMSQEQWAALFLGDEAYAGARSFERFQAAVQDYTGKRFVLPVHQGRAAEKILAQALIQPGDTVISNTFFDTTLANFLFRGARAVELPAPESHDFESDAPFKGNVDLAALEQTLQDLKRRGQRVALFTMTITNNTRGGQPVSLDNLRRTAEVLKAYEVPFHIDACRASENAYFIKKREPGQESRSIAEIVRESLSFADVVTMSTKKDGLANVGGFIATDREDLYREFSQYLVLWEGFLTYGGLSGRDLEAIAVGLKESLEESYLAYRIGQVAYLASGLREQGVPVYWPPGGHAVYVDAKAWLPHIPREQFPGQALVVALYREGAVRAVELGSLMFGKEKQVERELVRMALPRRVYTQRHLDHVLETFGRLAPERHRLHGFRIVYEPPYLRHFLAELAPVAP